MFGEGPALIEQGWQASQIVVYSIRMVAGKQAGKLQVRLCSIGPALLLALILSACADPDLPESPEQVETPGPIGIDPAVIANPERGFYAQDTPMWLDEERVPQQADSLRALRAEGITLARWYFLIDEYRERDLDEEALAYIESQFDAAREAGIKVIPRFAYNFPQGGGYPYDEPDASLDQTLRHIEQLEPVFSEHADVIAFVEAGFIGAWGEWHSSTHGHVDEESGVSDSGRDILTALLDALPTGRMVALRYGLHKQQITGTDQPLDESAAFDGSMAARLGAHNDCFLASATDWGTYPENPAEREALRAYLHDENRYLPQGGETCNAGLDALATIGCENALAELETLRFSALNRDYHEAVLQGWRIGGCYEEIAARLGYRFRLVKAEWDESVAPGDMLTVSLRLINEGFASPYNPRALEVVLRSQVDGAIYRSDFSADQDPRRWLPDLGEFEIALSLALPGDLPPGDYDLLLALPDPAPTLRERPDYAIRLEGADWEGSTGMNRLGTLRVAP